jgi:hypothetical protein
LATGGAEHVAGWVTGIGVTWSLSDDGSSPSLYSHSAGVDQAWVAATYCRIVGIAVYEKRYGDAPVAKGIFGSWSICCGGESIRKFVFSAGNTGKYLYATGWQGRYGLRKKSRT